MIVRILVTILIAVLVICIAYWLFTGGISRTIAFAKSYDNPFALFSGTSTGGALGSLRLPGQPDSPVSLIDITPSIEGQNSVGGNAQSSDAEQLNKLQEQYDELYAKVKDPKNFGNPSPYKGKVTIGTNTAQDSSVNTEYLTLIADYRNTAPVSLSGWSVQSAVTGVRIAIPPAAPNFISGILNTAAPVVLVPGSSAVVVSGASPVGVSFRENRCSGYLGDVQSFTPELQSQCPTAEEELPLIAQNIQTYGDACIDFAKDIPPCHFPGPDPAPAVTPACRDFLLTRLSYNGCVQAHRIETGFYSNAWRLYLASAVNIWRDTHDVVRLLDEEGRTVDVLTY